MKQLQNNVNAHFKIIKIDNKLVCLVEHLQTRRFLHGRQRLEHWNWLHFTSLCLTRKFQPKIKSFYNDGQHSGRTTDSFFLVQGFTSSLYVYRDIKMYLIMTNALAYHVIYCYRKPDSTVPKGKIMKLLIFKNKLGKLTKLKFQKYEFLV